jgi:thiamine kinase-like enzyme
VHWNSSNVPPGLWEEGSFWQLGTRRHELDDLEDVWIRYGLDTTCAEEIHDILTTSRFRTVIHGDAKAANFFFYDGQEGYRNTVARTLRIGGYDFQYSGMATPLRDVAYFLCCSMRHDLIRDHEDALLLYYYNELCASLCQQDADEYHFDEMKSIYDVCVVDLARFMAGSRWWGNIEYIEHKTRCWLANRKKKVLSEIQPKKIVCIRRLRNE